MLDTFDLASLEANTDEYRPAHRATSRRLRILHVAEAFSSGVFEVVRQTANYVTVAGHEVHVAHSQRPWTPEDFRSKFLEEVKLHRLDWDVERKPGVLARGAVQLARLVRSETFDVVHCHSSFGGLAGALVLPRGSVSVYTPHGYAFTMATLSDSAKRALKTVERRVGKRYSVVGAVSDAEGRQATAIGLRNVVVIRNGIEELNDVASRLRAEPGVPGERSGVVAVGRMSPQRQPGDVAKIFRAVGRSTNTSWIGDKTDAEAVAQFEKIGTHLTGWLPRESVLERLRSARVYLHWAAWDGNPLSILEAIASGAAVVGHDIPPAREILGGEWLFGDTASAAAAVERLLQDDQLFMETRRRQVALSARFSGVAMASRWCSLYEELTSARSRVADQRRRCRSNLLAAAADLGSGRRFDKQARQKG